MKAMVNFRTVLKRTMLAIVAAVVAITFAQTGRAQAPCLIARGLDPLDVLNSGVRHNVWIVLDSSGSMGGNFGGEQSRIEAARDVLTEVINEFVDASGRPLVNWGFVRFGQNQRNDSTACSGQFQNSCVGLNMTNLINPPACDQPNNASAVTGALAAAVQSNGDPVDGGWTPNGISMDQISQEIANNFIQTLLPNQKNFIILVTDGDDTCECRDFVWTPSPVPPFASQNVIPDQLRGGTVDWSYTFTENGRADRQAINAGTKGRLAYERLNPTAADRATGAKGGSFVIGMGLGNAGQRRANHMAWEASGAYYGNPDAFHALFADDKAALKQALRDAFAKIGVPASEVTLGSPVVGTVREAINTYTNTAVSASEHDGDVTTPDPDDVKEARTVRASHKHNVLFSSSVEIPGFKGHLRAHNIYKVTDPADPIGARQPDFTQMWDAGKLLQAMSPDLRNLYFNRRGETFLRPFDTANVTDNDLGVSAGYLSEIDGVGALSDDDARDMVVQVVRGYRLSKHPTTGTLYKPDGSINFSEFEADGVTKTWKLYDMVAAPAVMPMPTRAPDFDPYQNHADKYGVGGDRAGDGFYWDHFNRQTMLYVPTNGGVMHGFDAGTGIEVFGYIPDDVVGMDSNEVGGSRDTLQDFVRLVVAENNGIANHQFLLSGSPTVGEAFLRSDFGGDDEWHTLLTFGRGRGGRFVSALDISDPQNPQFVFNVGNREGIKDGDLDGLGETWSIPVMGNVREDVGASDPDRVDQWLAFLGGGYGCDSVDDEGEYLFALRLEDGSVYHRAHAPSDPNALIPHNALVAMPRLFNPHEKDTSDNEDYVTRVYIGDVQGNIWKLVTRDEDPNNWTFVKFAELGDRHPITAPVGLIRDSFGQDIYVMAGTGGDQRVDSVATGEDFKFVALLDKDLEGSNTSQYPLGSTPLWSKDLNPEERVYVTPVVIGAIGVQGQSDAVVFFAASRPEFDPAVCETKFFSSLFALGVKSGSAAVDLDGGGMDESVDLGESKVTGLYSRGNELYVAKSGGLGAAGGLSVYGDGDFSEALGSTINTFNIQVLVDGFRMSPF